MKAVSAAIVACVLVLGAAAPRPTGPPKAGAPRPAELIIDAERVQQVVRSIAGQTLIVDWHGTWDYTTIQAALDASTNGDTILVLPSAGSLGDAYVENLVIPPRALTLRSINPEDPAIVEATVIDGDFAGSVVTLEGGGSNEVAIEGFTIEKGLAVEGGGIRCEDSTLTLRHCVIRNNSNGYTDHLGGGGIYSAYCSLSLQNCLVTENLGAQYGGGLLCTHGTLSISDSTFLRNTLILTGEGIVRGGGVFSYKSATTIARSTFSGNFIRLTLGGQGVGGAVFCESWGSSVELTDCTVTSNGVANAGWGAASGGGISCSGGNVEITRCTISENVLEIAQGGSATAGGIDLDAQDAVLADCTISNNRITITGTDPYGVSSGRGGGIATSSHPESIQGCTITGNVVTVTGADAYARGGGALIAGEGTTMTNCQIRGNLARATGEARDTQGGGLFCESGAPVITNCAIEDNAAISAPDYGMRFARGGGLYVGEECSPTLVNCTVRKNAALGDNAYGGGVYSEDGAAPTLINCILWDDTPDEAYWESPGAVVRYCDVRGGHPGEGNIDSDPLFALDADAHLVTGSPCIDAGTSGPAGLIPGDDLDGQPRPLGDGVDMGAYEFDENRVAIAVSPRVVEFRMFEEETGSFEETLLIRSSGGQTLEWEITEDCSWLSVSPTSGESDGDIDEVTVTANTGGLSAGDYECPLVISAPAAVNSPATVPVVIRVGAVRRVPSEYATIQDAIDAAEEGDIVLIADGVYEGEGNTEIDFSGKSITVRGENGPANCVVDCGGSSVSGFYFHSGETSASVLEGLTITNGRFGVYCSYSSPRIVNCWITRHVGAASRRGSGTGALWFQGGNPTVSSCRVSGNYTSGVFCQDSDLVFSNCTISGNATGYSQQGGGFHCRYSDPTIRNCTISGNSVIGYTPYGGGVYAESSNPTITNSILWGNVAENGPEIALTSSASPSTLTVSYSDIQGGPAAAYVEPGSQVIWGAGNIDEDPWFVDPDGPDHDPQTWEDNDYHLQPSSPCINTGDPGFVPQADETDVDGEPRVQGCRVDMGAYEYQGPFGDFYEDCDVDLEDYELFEVCLSFSGPAEEPPFQECLEVFDFDADGDVDLGDFGYFQLFFGELM